MEDLLLEIVKVAIPVGVAIGVFLIGRELVMWYFKINERILIQKEILKELKKLNANTEIE